MVVEEDAREEVEVGKEVVEVSTGWLGVLLLRLPPSPVGTFEVGWATLLVAGGMLGGLGGGRRGLVRGNRGGGDVGTFCNARLVFGDNFPSPGAVREGRGTADADLPSPAAVREGEGTEDDELLCSVEGEVRDVSCSLTMYPRCGMGGGEGEPTVSLKDTSDIAVRLLGLGVAESANLVCSGDGLGLMLVVVALAVLNVMVLALDKVLLLMLIVLSVPLSLFVSEGALGVFEISLGFKLLLIEGVLGVFEISLGFRPLLIAGALGLFMSPSLGLGSVLLVNSEGALGRFEIGLLALEGGVGGTRFGNAGEG